MDALLWEVLANGSPDDVVEVLIKFSDIDKVPDAVTVVAQIGDIASCRIQIGDIEAIRANDNVASMKASRAFSLEPPIFEENNTDFLHTQDALSFTERQSFPFTGEGVFIGIADWGFDFTHPNFLNEDGSTRFFAVWDQGAAYDGFNAYGYGTIHYRDEINDALESDFPFESLDYHPGKSDIFHQGMHGTHVLDIAAGNGFVGVSGVAPAAEIIAVHLATKEFKDLMGLGESSRVFDAIHFLDKTAGNQPLVINMSVGSHGDAHMGLSLIEQAIDHLVTSKKDRAVVQSCGNYYTGRTHSSGTLVQGQEFALEWLISDKDMTANEIEVWYESQDEITVSIVSPNNNIILKEQGLGKSKIHDIGEIEIGRIYLRNNEPSTGLSQVFIILDKNASPGRWQIVLKGEKIVSGRIGTWIERDKASGPNNQSRFPKYQANSQMTTGSICNNHFSVSVGAINPNDGKIGFFSSVGPTWDGRQVPYLTAPGVGIVAAKSSSPFQNSSRGELTSKTGTSMAAPYVTGAIALLYEASEIPLSIEEVRAKLANACIDPATDDLREKSRYGLGTLDIQQLLKPYIIVPVTKIQTENKFVMALDAFVPSFTSIESLMESYEEEFPELQSGNLADFFESLPFERDLDIQVGDCVLRRQYGSEEAAWSGVVESFINGEALIRTKKGTRKLIPAKVGWELKRIKPKGQKQKQEEPQVNEEPLNSDEPDNEVDNSGFTEDLDENEKVIIVKKINAFTPTRSDTIVINMLEYDSGISNVENHKQWKKNTAVNHNKNINNFRSHSDIIHLVLHETASDSGNGFDGSNNLTSHLSVTKDAKILQFNDLIEWENHAPGMNKTGIGIEFVNRSWLSSSKVDGGEGIPSKASLLTDEQKEKYKEENGYLWAFWGIGNNIYRLPTKMEQLEKEVELVNWITGTLKTGLLQKMFSEPSFEINMPLITQRWLQLVSYNDVREIWKFKEEAIPLELEKDDKRFFIMTMAFDFFPKTIKVKSGIISHSVIETKSKHGDGSFLSLYTWLRLIKNKNLSDAYEIAKKLMKNHFIRVVLRSDSTKQIILLDVRDTNLI